MIPVLTRPPFARRKIIASSALSPVTGMSLWMKADAIAGLSDADPVTTWADSSGNAYDFAGSGATRPTYKTGIVNSKAIVRFSGSNFLARTAALSNYIGASSATITAVMRQVGTKANNTILATSGASPWFLLLPSYGDVLYFDFGSPNPGTGRNSVAQPVGWDDTWHVVTFVKDGTTAQKIIVDGIELASSSQTGTLSLASTTLCIGSYTSGGSDSFQGDLAEMLIYSTALNSTDRATNQAYLAAKYAL